MQIDKLQRITAEGENRINSLETKIRMIGSILGMDKGALDDSDRSSQNSN